MHLPHLYPKNARLVRHPQKRMNPTQKDIDKTKLQKILSVDFRYPILESQWLSPLVIVPKKNGEWQICIEYKELNKATLKNHFPLRFIDQVLDTLA